MTVARRLPEAYEERLLSSQKYVLKLRKQNEYLLGQIGNATRHQYFFDMQESTSVNSAGK
jgi:hypothetical protein